jgi:hypothetical protein
MADKPVADDPADDVSARNKAQDAFEEEPMNSVRCALCATLLMAATSASAQVPPTVLAGLPVACISATGQPVVSVFQPLNDIARASTANGTPIILLNPQITALPGPVQWFVYAHECMHHQLGHALGNMSLSMEVDADCGGMKLVRNQGLVTAQTLGIVTSYYQNNPGLPPLYPPGPQRVARMIACFNSP